MHRLTHRGGRDLAQRRIIVQHPDAAAVGGDHQAVAPTARMPPRPGTGTSGFDTSSHVLPSSLASLIRPLLVPTQITPRRTVDSASDWIAPPMGAPGAPRPRTLSGGGVTSFG